MQNDLERSIYHPFKKASTGAGTGTAFLKLIHLSKMKPHIFSQHFYIRNFLGGANKDKVTPSNSNNDGQPLLLLECVGQETVEIEPLSPHPGVVCQSEVLCQDDQHPAPNAVLKQNLSKSFFGAKNEETSPGKSWYPLPVHLNAEVKPLLSFIIIVQSL